MTDFVPRRRSIWIQLLALALAAILPITGAVVYLITDASRATLNQAEDEIRNLAATTANNLAATLAESERLLSALSERPLVRALDPKRCDPIVAEFAKLNPLYANPVTRDVRGERICSLLPGVSPASTAVTFPWFHEGIRSRGFIAGNAFHSSASGHWLSVLTHPLLDDRGEPIGVLAIGIDLLELQARILPAARKNVVVSVIDRQGRFLMRSTDPERWLGKSVNNPGTVSTARFTPEGIYRVKGVDGIARTFAYRTDPRSGWVVSVGIPEDMLFAPFRQRLAAALAVVVVTLFLALILVRKIGADIAGPIRDLEATTEKVAGGDLAARASVAGPAEVASVAEDLNRMLEVRERADTELHDLNRTLMVLSSCHEALVRATGEQELLDEMCRILVERGGHALAWIGFAEPGGAKRVRPAATFGAAGYLDTFEVSWGEDELGQGPTGTAIRTGQPVFIRDTLTDDSFRPWRANAERFGLRSTIALPLGRDLPAFGALCIYSAEPNRFNEREVRLLLELVNDVAYGVQSLRADARRRQVEDEVRLQDRRFRALVENGADGIALVGDDATILYMGSSITRILGYAVEDVQGRSGFEFLHPDDVEEVAKHIQKSIAHPASVVVATTRARRKDGTWRSFEIAFTNLRGEPSVQAIVANFRDITERLESERSQRESDERFRQIAESIREVFWMTDPSKNTILYVSPAYQDIWQRSVGELYRDPRQWVEAIHPEDRERVLGAAGKQASGSYDEEYRILRPDGTLRWIRDRAFPVRNVQGEVYRIAGTAEDITERRLAEEFLRASEERFEAAFHASPAPLWIVDAKESRFSDVNRAWLELMGYEREQVIGRVSTEFGLWVDEAERRNVIAAVLRDGSVDRYEVVMRRGDGEVRTCLISSRRFEYEGLQMRLASLWDVTDQRRAQKQMEEMNTILERSVEQRTRELKGANSELHRALETLRSAQDQLLHSEKMAALGRLVAGVAHELNTPIGNGLLVATTLSEKTQRFAAEAGAGLRRSTLEAYVEHSREAADMLTRNLKKAADLVTSFKQVAADQTSSQRRSFRLDEVVDEVLSTHRPMLRKTPIEVESQVPPGIVMDSFPGPLGQVLANLIHNAIVHAHEGRAHGSVLIGARLLEDEVVELSVRDDGHGIAEDDLRRVFDPFFTTKLGRGGTGLGLPICHNLVTQTLGGEIRIESTPGAGTSVIIRLPLKAPDASGPDAGIVDTYAV